MSVSPSINTSKPAKFLVKLRTGHVGAGKFNEFKRIIRAKNVVEAYEIAKRLPGTKKGKTNIKGVVSITPV